MKLKLKAKATAAILLLAVILTSVALFVSYYAYANAIDEHYRSMASNLTKTTALMVDVDLVEKYTKAVAEIYLKNTKPEWNESESQTYYEPYRRATTGEGYQKLFRTLEKIKQANKVLSLYIIYVDKDSASCVYVIDADNSETGCPAGTWDIIYEQNYGIFTNPEEGFPAYITNTETFGWLCSAGSAITSREGDVIAYVMTDISMDEIMRERHHFLMQLFTILVMITMILLLFFIYIVNKTIVNPINWLASATRGLVVDLKKGREKEIHSSLSRLGIRNKDEIGTLYDSIQFMERELNRYIDDLSKVMAEKERIGAELSIAAQIQADMLPSIFPAFPERKEIDIYASMTPAKEVGGDFYDFFMVDERHLAMVIADVSGKGVPASLFMVIGKTLIKDHTTDGKNLGNLFTEVNQLLCESNKEGLFITAFECVLDLVTGELVFVNAGHELPLIKKENGIYEIYRTRPGFVLAGMEGIRYQQDSLFLEPGDQLFLYTDGVTEATNEGKELYGMKRLEHILNQNKDKESDELLSTVKADIDKFVGQAPQFDDITMLSMKFRQKMR